MLEHRERGSPLNVAFVLFCACRPLFLSQELSVCVTMGTACFLYLFLLTPPPLNLHRISFSLHPLLSGFSVTIATHVCLPATCFTCRPVCSASLSATGCWHALCLPFCCCCCCLLFVYLFCVHSWLSVCCVHLCLCLLCLFSPPLFLPGCLSGHQAVPPLIPSLLFLLCCSVLSLSTNITLCPRFSVLLFAFSPPDSIVCSHIKTVSIECHWEHTVKKKGKKKGGI